MQVPKKCQSCEEQDEELADLTERNLMEAQRAAERETAAREAAAREVAVITILVGGWVESAKAVLAAGPERRIQQILPHDKKQAGRLDSVRRSPTQPSLTALSLPLGTPQSQSAVTGGEPKKRSVSSPTPIHSCCQPDLCMTESCGFPLQREAAARQAAAGQDAVIETLMEGWAESAKAVLTTSNPY